jgi:hypothetical protein
LLTEAEQEAKLRLVAETAREVWGESRPAESIESEREVRLS